MSVLIKITQSIQVKILVFNSSKYENFVIGDFNAEMTNSYLEEFRLTILRI